MEVNIDPKRLASDSPQKELFDALEAGQERYGLKEAHLFFGFPVLKDADEEVVLAELILVSKTLGLLIFAFSPETRGAESVQSLAKLDQALEKVYSLLFSRLVRNKDLRGPRMTLSFDVRCLIYAPRLDAKPVAIGETVVVVSDKDLGDFFAEAKRDQIGDEVFSDLMATLEGSRGLMRPRARPVPSLSTRLKGAIANKAESEITYFDNRQQRVALSPPEGIVRVRGLAGSGKTVVLAMKAAITHLKYPDALIVYTFYTKSLYQHIQRLVTRFYKQFDDREPDWSRLRILHGWGGNTSEGVYFNACKANGVSPLTFMQAKAVSSEPFDAACKQLLESTSIKPAYDFVFVDEGQDFPSSFMRLCLRLSEHERVVFAYDDLQTIFQPSTPDFAEVIGADQNGKPLAELNEDMVLYKCYRNPREVLVCAHAVGFGIYGKIVQMLENKAQWEDVGYRVLKGEFTEHSITEIERPAENSLAAISLAQEPDEIVRALVFDDFDKEVSWIANSISKDIEEGLRADDILVAIADDRNARNYIKQISNRLTELSIPFNNIHEDTFGIPDFYRDGHVTLSTVHKAKGNEAFMVYVVGVDALFKTYAGVRERNILFTAMTRAKGWVRVTGIGEGADACRIEIETALRNYPILRFEYPSQQQLRIIKRDLDEGASRKQKAERILEEILRQLSPEEVRRFLDHRAIKKGN